MAPKTHRFYSKSDALIVRVPELVEPAIGGSFTVVQREKSYQFQHSGADNLGWIEVEDGEDLMRTGPQERAEDGSLVWDGAHPVLELEDVATFLRRSPLFNQYFWEEGEEPDVQRPTEDEVLDLLVEAVVNDQPDAVEDLLAQELGTDENPGHRRERVIQRCEKALEKIAERATVSG